MTTTPTTPTKTIKRTRKATTEPVSTHPLAAHNPPMSSYENYISREVYGIEDFTIIDVAHEQQQAVLIQGPTGAAKTSFIEAYAAKKRLPLINISCEAGIDFDSLIGGPGYDGSGKVRPFIPGTLPLGLLYGAVFNVDEVNALPPKRTAGWHSMFDYRRSLDIREAVGSGWCASCGLYNDADKKRAEEEQQVLLYLGKRKGAAKPILCDMCGEQFQSMHIKAHPDFIAIGAMNPDYEGTYQMNEAFKNRFGKVLEWGYLEKIEKELLWSPTLIGIANKLRSRIGTDIHTPVGTNRLIQFEDDALREELGLGFAVDNFIHYFAPDERTVVADLIRHDLINLKKDLFEDEEDDEDVDPEDPTA